MATNLIFRRIATADWPAVDVLAARTYGESFGVDSWRRKHDENPLEENAPWAVGAFDGTRAVGFFSMLPLPLRVDGQLVNSNQIIDLMTDPDYRGQGIFDKLAAALYQQMVDDGHQLSIAFNVPGTAAHKGHLKHGYKMLGPLVQYTKVHRLRTFCAGKDGWPLIRRAAFGIYAHRVAPTLASRRPQACASRIMPEYRDDHLRWRGRLNPGRWTELCNDSSARLLVNGHDDDLYILVCKGLPEQVKRLLQRADQIARAHGFATVRTSVTEHSYFCKHLEAAGYRKHGRERVLSILPVGENTLDVFNFHDWHLMLGDTDNL
ncbi:MAG: GNAT family N-acetyltransferase [Candidatus Eiseniibacteriota bacterium]|nr:MAG: GNAT family N-acetyltransferase [Candidatus Eisenbacteria bacterium]